MTTAVLEPGAPSLQNGGAQGETGSGKLPGQRSKLVLKHSPTLLFDILSEPDKDKLNAKLKGATVAGPVAPAQAGVPRGAQQPQQLLPPPPAPAAGQRNLDLDLEAPQKAAAAAAAEAGLSVSAAASSGSAGAWGSSAEGSSTATTTTTTGGSGGSGSGSGSGNAPTEPHPHKPASASAAASGAAAAATAAAEAVDAAVAGQQAGAAPAAAATAAQAAEVAASGTNSEALAVATAPTAAAAAAAADPLAEFTPRVILQELLGELFIAPERLTAQGSFGAGAFATVQSCSLDPPDGCGGPRLLVAVKSLKPEVLEDVEDLRRFLLEANLVRKLHHPNIVSIHGLGAHRLDSLDSLRASAYVVMEACEGGDLKMMVLRQMTGRSPAYSRLDALRWLTHIAAACAYLHETCRPMVIHRDLKLENVLLTGGPVDGRVAKITDFGLHKRAMHSRAEDALIAVTNEWSTRGGSVYRTDGAGGGGGTAAYGSGHGGAAAYGRQGAGAGGVNKDPSFYGGRNYYAGGGGADASYYGGLNGSGHAYGGGGGGSTSARYVALASAGVAAVAAERSVRHGSVHGSVHGGVHGGGGGGGAPLDPFLAAAGIAADAAAGGAAGADVSAHSLGASAPGGGGSLRAGSEAAEALGLAAMAMGGGGGGNGSSHGGAAGSGPLVMVGEREKPYLLALDKGRYDSPVPTSKFNSTNDLVAMHDAAAGAAAAAARTVSAAAVTAAAATAPLPPLPPRASVPPPLAGWAPPHVVPPASHEESVHRKMLALMFVRAATMTLQAEAAAAAAATSNEGGGGAAAADGDAAGNAAAAALTPSPLTLMRSMTLALQQQKEQEQVATATAAAGTGAATAAGGGALSLSPASSLQSPSALPPLGGLLATAQSRATRGSGAAGGGGMKTVPEENRMSMDLGPRPNVVPGMRNSRGSGGGAARDGSGGGGGGGPGTGSDRSVRGGAAPPPGASATAAAAASAGRLVSAAASKREKVAAAAAKMADATQQVGSLIYMAPELVTSGSYNEKVDVFSFAVIAYELFNGKLLAMKVANDAAYAEMGAGGGGAAPATPPGAGAGTRSAEQAAQDGVMAYVLRRSGGVREPLPGWWPAELKHLIAACWAQDPTQRPPFSKIFRELRKMAADGTLAEMDARDPLRGGGCGCTIS
ncbi:hypothetical protein CHLRE_14g632860v5 [Chlamydomonas reinhardtii]|uniref:Protein kinase domain-containing protein n=1 Tax=Chlamydomonas reinhardtii TaxID=3055 RepID=A0A2K3CYV4_CHLRE|nr:uncharacterized protein CHLRE_14g632860v5 [Chlamydomonas reinhardtii]PNW73467.1 hypothetical protein CHLRE_14g632860v5 [Chlamydomonas reinhardtii]